MGAFSPSQSQPVSTEPSCLASSNLFAAVLSSKLHELPPLCPKQLSRTSCRQNQVSRAGLLRKANQSRWRPLRTCSCIPSRSSRRPPSRRRSWVSFLGRRNNKSLQLLAPASPFYDPTQAKAKSSLWSPMRSLASSEPSQLSGLRAPVKVCAVKQCRAFGCHLVTWNTTTRPLGIIFLRCGHLVQWGALHVENGSAQKLTILQTI